MSGSPPRVVFLSPAAGLGGAERALCDLVEGIAVESPRTAMALVAPEEGPLTARARAAGAVVRLVAPPDGFAAFGDTQWLGRSRARIALHAGAAVALAAPGLARYFVELRRAVLAHRPDVVHSNGLKTHALAAALGLGVPVLWHVRELVGERPLARGLLRALAPRARLALAISEPVRRDVARIFPRLPVELLGDATNLDAFRPAPPGEDEGAAARDVLDALAEPRAGSAPPTTVCVGLVATYATWKGHRLFLEAAADLRRRRPDLELRFYVVGGPIYRTANSQHTRAELAGVARDLGLDLALGGDVAFVPFQPDPAAVYRALDVVVHASTRVEPFGLVIAEAMACGRPVVAAANAGAAEQLAPGRDALTFEPGSAPALSLAIEALASDPELRRALGVAARATAELKFSRERLVRDMLRIFERVAAAPAR